LYQTESRIYVNPAKPGNAATSRLFYCQKGGTFGPMKILQNSYAESGSENDHQNAGDSRVIIVYDPKIALRFALVGLNSQSSFLTKKTE